MAILSEETEAVFNASIFEKAADELAEKGFSILENFFSLRETAALKARIIELNEAGVLRKAGVGQGEKLQVIDEIRNDRIYWIERENAVPQTLEFLDRIDELRIFLKRSLFLPLSDFECHYADYPVGAFYKRHSDRFKGKEERVLTFVLYLNPEWQESDGGQLRLYLPENKELTILPQAGRLALFLSETEHEVLTAHRERFSITGWMRNRPLGLSFLG